MRLSAGRPEGRASSIVVRARLAALAFVLLPPCHADVVVLKNGDRLAGEILKLEKQRLSLKTAYAGTLMIDWRMVERLSTERPLEIQFDSGLRASGRIQECPQGIEILTEKGAIRTAAPRVAAMTRTREQAGWRGNLQGNVDVGHSLIRGNSTLSQSSLGITTRYRAETTTMQLGLISLFSRQGNTPATSRHSLTVRYDVPLSLRSFAFTLTTLERDDRQRLNRRWNLGGGWGRKLVKSDRSEASILGGFTYANEDFRGTRNSSGEALAGFDLDTTMANRFRLTSKLALYPGFFNGSRYRVVFDGGLRVPLIGRFTWNLRVYDRFDSRPPLPVRRNDYGLINGIGIGF